MLRKVRIVLATIMWLAITLLFLGVGWRLSLWLSWAAKIQFLPALMALDFGVLIGLSVITILFGRIYCSVVCPLGVMQDLFGWLGKKSRKNRYSHSPERRYLRYGILAVFVICMIIGFAPVTTLLAPYSAYGRIINSLFKPLYDMLINGMAHIEANYNSYLFSEAEIWMRSVTTFIVALLTLAALGILAWRGGRTYCNTVCPVGTILSFFARFSLMRIEMDKDKCKNCSLCERNCKASAIDYKTGKVDYSRCVVCGDCLDVCRHDALHYNLRDSLASAKHSSHTDTGKRAFLTGAALAVGAAAMAETKIKVDGGLAVLEDKQAPLRETPVTPPGSVSLRNMSRHCTACQLCVSSCPNNVLRPSTDPMRFMQPQMSYERGWCRPECIRCSEVCPAGAILPITKEDKTAIHVGHAVWIPQNCVPIANGDECGHCADVCPARAILMVDYSTGDGRKVQVPAVNPDRCIGCGACEHLCPARPFSAIYVEGHNMHRVDA